MVIVLLLFSCLPDYEPPIVLENPDHDWDGDGYSELYYDCDDADPDSYPGAPDPSLDCGYGECTDHIDGTYSQSLPEPTGETLDCCLMVADVLGFDALFEYEYKEACCDLIAENGEFSSACTPWGPPVPPRMPARAIA